MKAFISIFRSSHHWSFLLQKRTKLQQCAHTRKVTTENWKPVPGRRVSNFDLCHNRVLQQSSSFSLSRRWYVFYTIQSSPGSARGKESTNRRTNEPFLCTTTFSTKNIAFFLPFSPAHDMRTNPKPMTDISVSRFLAFFAENDVWNYPALTSKYTRP